MPTELIQVLSPIIEIQKQHQSGNRKPNAGELKRCVIIQSDFNTYEG